MRDLNQTFRMARRMDIDPKAAAEIKCRYLYDRMDDCLADWSPVAELWFWEDVEEAMYLLDNAPTLQARKNSPYEEKVLDIEGAKAYPITELVEFGRNGKAKAWCHDDKHPSLTHNKKNNTVRCWPCSKSYNPIDVLMCRDGMSFPEAVIWLTK